MPNNIVQYHLSVCKLFSALKNIRTYSTFLLDTRRAKTDSSFSIIFHLTKDFRSVCAAKEINANVCFNKRNGNVDRDEYFDQKLYDERYAIERTNAWMDSFRSLLNRFDTTTESWKGFNYLSFMVLALKKFKTKKSK